LGPPRTPLAYWAEAANKPYSVIQIEPSTVNEPHTKSVAYPNGVKIHVLFDTGSTQSLLTLRAAKQAGITRAAPE
jgi:predicted aspartyl protease